MERITQTRLLEAGWNINRKIDISSIKEGYKKYGMEMPENVDRFLSEYGMLVFKYSQNDLELIPEKAWGSNLDSDYFKDLLIDYGIDESVYPIGVACRNNLIVLMTAENVFYRFTDGYLELSGKCVEDMLDCLVGECRQGEKVCFWE